MATTSDPRVTGDGSVVTVCAGCGAELEPVKRGRARKWCSDRCRKQTLYSTPCVDCGKPLNGSDGRGAHQRCQPCDALLAGPRARERFHEHKLLVERLWADGLTARQIADQLGWQGKDPNVHICVLRGRGYHLPHRRTPEQLARITAGGGQRLAKARAVYAAQRAAA